MGPIFLLKFRYGNKIKTQQPARELRAIPVIEISATMICISVITVCLLCEKQ